jgi:hypothetical protein
MTKARVRVAVLAAPAMLERTAALMNNPEILARISRPPQERTIRLTTWCLVGALMPGPAFGGLPAGLIAGPGLRIGAPRRF